MKIPRAAADAIAAALAAGRATAGPAPKVGGPVEVPVPPSSNNLFPTGRNGRRYASPEYTAWRAAAGPLVAGLTPPEAYPVHLRYTLRGKVNPRRDIGNLEKALTDLLVSCGVLADDRLGCVRAITLRYEPDEGEPRVGVEIDPEGV